MTPYYEDGRLTVYHGSHAHAMTRLDPDPLTLPEVGYVEPLPDEPPPIVGVILVLAAAIVALVIALWAWLR